jgi:hypothetical protein
MIIYFLVWNTKQIYDIPCGNRRPKTVLFIRRFRV